MTADRILLFAGGLSGAAGVALSAAAAHQGGGTVTTAASFLLMHAPAFAAIGLGADRFAGRTPLRVGGFVLLVGLALFSGDLLMRHYTGDRLFPMAAPSGGTLMIGGWSIVALSALWRREPVGAKREG
ncbi:MAG: DUF423 domain-containing protein [Mesorhizobium sp.]|nr:DUF423 domain-containing protein [Mesorhizobium sp.]